MDYHTEEIDINNKLDQLKLALPKGLAFFPENLEEANEVADFIFPEPVTQINKVFKSNALDIVILGENLSLLKSRKNSDIYLPSIFLGLSLLTENPTVASVALNVLSNYITDFLKGSFGQRNVSLEIYVETTAKKTIKKITYSGDAEGIKNLVNIIKN